MRAFLTLLFVLLVVVAVLAGGCTLIFTGEAFFTPNGAIYTRPFWVMGLITTAVSAALAWAVRRWRNRQPPR